MDTKQLFAEIEAIIMDSKPLPTARECFAIMQALYAAINKTETAVAPDDQVAEKAAELDA